FYAENGSYHYQDVTITDSHPLGEITFADAIAQSSNICFAKLSQRFHADKFYKYIRDFGFGIPTGIDLPGEVRGDIPKPDEYTTVTQVFNAFGYGVTVTPLQLACAYGAIANGGVLMKPYIVKECIGADGKCVEAGKPQAIRRVVSQGTATEMTKLFCGVVQHGTGTLARLASIQVAGKTGTSQQVEGGKYSKEKYSASFVGYFPAEDPQIVLLVVLDAPKNGYYGGSVSAPIFRNIAAQVITTRSYHAQLPEFVAQAGSNSQKVCVPDVRYLGAESAKQMLGECGLKFGCEGSGDIVVSQSPAAGTYVNENTQVSVALAPGGHEPDTGAPNAVGLTVRQAVNLFASQGIPVRVVGSGRIERQLPPSTTATQNVAWTLYGTVLQ
ncbi:MAG TPA: penicillin-binding transpeptidase domain-containing protein, partial [Candidatus Kapabacteria bacterium]|nr:penicillin-binding transpeptidase domain-containing protein [Candidatus Kapabacteria bacterium]